MLTSQKPYFCLASRLGILLKIESSGYALYIVAPRVRHKNHAPITQTKDLRLENAFTALPKLGKEVHGKVSADTALAPARNCMGLNAKPLRYLYRAPEAVNGRAGRPNGHSGFPFFRFAFHTAP